MSSENLNVQALADLDVKHVWHHLMQHQAFASKAPMIIAEGNGLRIRDANGKEFLDATSGGVWCVNVGYGRERIANAVCEQLKKMPYYAASAGNIPTIKFSEKLLSHMPGLSRVYISNSGSEANEKAFKMIRALAHINKTPQKKKILYRDRDYHGTTIGALSATGQPERKEWFGPFVEGFVQLPHACCYRCPFGLEYPSCDVKCAREVETVIQKEGPDTVGAVFFEPITAGGGIIPPVKEYYKIIKEVCEKYNVLFIMDEVVCGIGRTGTMFGYEHYGILPDIVTMAKGVASAYMPISCTVTTEAVFNQFLADPADQLSYFRDISTYGGCAGSATAAYENLCIIEEENLLQNVINMGAYLLGELESLRDMPGVGDVRGKGLLCGIEFVADKKTKAPLPEGKVIAICGEMAALGVLVGRTNRSFPGGNNILNVAPAYVVTKGDIDTIIAALKKAVAKHLG